MEQEARKRPQIGKIWSQKKILSQKCQQLGKISSHVSQQLGKISSSHVCRHHGKI